MSKIDLSMDRKVTTLAVWEQKAKRWKPIIKNAVGTLAGETCPGATDWCFSEDGAQCYARKTEKMYTNAFKLVERNTIALKEASYEQKVDLYNRAIVEYKANHEKAQKRAPWDIPKVFRWKWDGDVADKAEARAIRAVCNLHPDVNFWIYTRSFDLVPFLLGPDNLVVYLSVDRFNLEKARQLHDDVDGVSLRYAFCGDDWAETEDLSVSLTGRNSPRCPELTGHYPLVVDKGNGFGQGACVECGLCIRGTNNVRFSSKH